MSEIAWVLLSAVAGFVLGGAFIMGSYKDDCVNGDVIFFSGTTAYQCVAVEINAPGP